MTDEEKKQLIREVAKEVTSEFDGKMQQYLKQASQESDKKIEAILEILRPLQDLPQQVQELRLLAEATFERVGELSVDVEILKRGIRT